MRGPRPWAGEIEAKAIELGYVLERVLLSPSLLGELLRPDEKALEAWGTRVDVDAAVAAERDPVGTGDA